MSDGLQQKIILILSDVLDVEKSLVNSESSSDTIPAWDSVGHLNLMIALEEQFGVQFAPEEVDAMHSIEALVRIVEQRIAAV